MAEEKDLDDNVDDNVDELNVENLNIGSCVENEAHDTEELVKFREKWKAELKGNDNVSELSQGVSRAEELYWMGVSAERLGDMSSALLHYRHAVQLVPDIEQKISRAQTDENVSLQRASVSNETGDKDCITQNISSKISLKDPLCVPVTRTRATHISALPLEILQCILCLAVLQDLDLRSLEQFGMVCKGFCVLARESFIWKRACLRLWGEKCNPVDYNDNWRLMYISYPHVHFNGIYISQSSYVRSGEQSLDNLYKPFHMVLYYRYLRFYSDGTVAYLTTPQEPANVIGQMKYKFRREGMMFGHYTQIHDTVYIVVSCSNDTSPTKRSQKHKAIVNVSSDRYEQLQMELEIINSRKKLSSRLHWKKFSCQHVDRPSGHVQINDFNIDHTYRYFLFSRVKSYSLIDQQN